jgi:catechol 2,3-dioxygenase-like lactoylglutathione lyase family enzyme
VFYRDGLGFPTDGITGTEFEGSETSPAGDVVMFDLAGGLILALYQRTELAKDAGIDLWSERGGEFSIGHLVGSRDEVDHVIQGAEAAGAIRTAGPHDRPWGIYAGYFRDPDGHLWEVVHNPTVAP